MGKIKGCFIDNQPGYYKDVFLGDVKIATIKALSKNDYAEIERASTSKKVVDGQIVMDFNSKQLEITRMYLSLTGNEKVGWALDKPVTKENIGILCYDVYDVLNLAIVELEQQNFISEGIEKN